LLIVSHGNTSPMAQRDLRKVKALAQRLRATEREFHAAILAAHESGETLRDIGQWAGLSYQRIHEIVKAQQREGG
jgi:hypothetical protein